MRTRVTPRKSPLSLLTLLTALTNMRSWRMLVSSSKIAAILIGRGMACKLGVASMRRGRRIRHIFEEDQHHQGMLVESHIFCKHGINLYRTSCQRYIDFWVLLFLESLRPSLVCILLKHEGRSQEAQRAPNFMLGPSSRGPQTSSHHLFPKEDPFKGLVPTACICAAELLLEGKYSFFSG